MAQSNANLARSVIVGADPYEEYDALLKKFQDSQREKEELLRELQRLKDQQEIIKMKNSSLGGGAGEAAAQQQGYQAIHLLLVAVVSLLIGALIK